jgi:hypothetical protein
VARVVAPGLLWCLVQAFQSRPGAGCPMPPGACDPCPTVCRLLPTQATAVRSSSLGMQGWHLAVWIQTLLSDLLLLCLLILCFLWGSGVPTPCSGL